MMNPADTHLMWMRWLWLFLLPGVFCFQIADLGAQAEKGLDWGCRYPTASLKNIADV